MEKKRILTAFDPRNGFVAAMLFYVLKDDCYEIRDFLEQETQSFPRREHMSMSRAWERIKRKYLYAFHIVLESE